MSGRHPIRYVALFNCVGEVDDTNAGSNAMDRSGLSVGVLAAGCVVVREDDNIFASNKNRATFRQTVTRAAERKRRQSGPRQRIHVLLAFGPVNELVSGKRFGRSIGHRLEAFRLSVLPARSAIGVSNTIDVERIAIAGNHLDPYRNAALSIDMPTLLTVTNARPHVATCHEARLALFVRRCAGREGNGSYHRLGRRHCDVDQRRLSNRHWLHIARQRG